jgi:phospholipid-binding lipoprotein MlaA
MHLTQLNSSTLYDTFFVKTILVSLIVTVLVFINLLFSSFALAEDDTTDEDSKYNYNYAEINNKCIPYDPYESINRKVFFVNGVLDTFMLRPVTKIYGRFTPNFLQDRIGNFTANIKSPLTVTNYAMQINGRGIVHNLMRFGINSTLGLAGLFDVAAKMGLKPEEQTFNNTLASYGIGPGPYIVLPIYGGTSARGATDSLFTNSYFNPLQYYLHSDFRKGAMVANLLHKRHLIMPFTDHITMNSVDPYIAIRNGILDNQETKMLYPQGFVCPKVK